VNPNEQIYTRRLTGFGAVGAGTWTIRACASG
jgi:hypothetical protein